MRTVILQRKCLLTVGSSLFSADTADNGARNAPAGTVFGADWLAFHARLQHLPRMHTSGTDNGRLLAGSGGERLKAVRAVDTPLLLRGEKPTARASVNPRSALGGVDAGT